MQFDSIEPSFSRLLQILLKLYISNWLFWYLSGRDNGGWDFWEKEVWSNHLGRGYFYGPNFVEKINLKKVWFIILLTNFPWNIFSISCELGSLTVNWGRQYQRVWHDFKTKVGLESDNSIYLISTLWSIVHFYNQQWPAWMDASASGILCCHGLFLSQLIILYDFF